MFKVKNIQSISIKNMQSVIKKTLCIREIFSYDGHVQQFHIRSFPVKV